MDVDELNNGKLKTVLIGLSKLSNGKLSKLSFRKTVYDKLVKKGNTIDSGEPNLANVKDKTYLLLVNLLAHKTLID